MIWKIAVLKQHARRNSETGAKGVNLPLHLRDVSGRPISCFRTAAAICCHLWWQMRSMDQRRVPARISSMPRKMMPDTRHACLMTSWLRDSSCELSTTAAEAEALLPPMSGNFPDLNMRACGRKGAEVDEDGRLSLPQHFTGHHTTSTRPHLALRGNATWRSPRWC